MTEADPIFVDSLGNPYLVRDVLGAGDCALLALLHNPNFHAPVSGVNELRRAIVSFARGQCRDECCTVFSLVAERNGVTFDCYLSQALQDGFWVGTVFFIWVTMCYGIDIRSHFFNAQRNPEFNSTCAFLEGHLPSALPSNAENRAAVNVLFHTYRDMKRCKPAMYNHFATLIPLLQFSVTDGRTLNAEVQAEVKPWWVKVDCSANDVKNSKGKKKLNKEERKKLHEALTYHYLKNGDQGTKVCQDMAERLEQAEKKEAAIAAALQVDVKDLDTGVSAPKSIEAITDTQMTRSIRVTDHYDRRNWLQRAKIVFIFLHPNIGAKHSADTAAFTGVKENTLLTWLYQKKMIQGWLPLVEAMDAATAIAALPVAVQDLFLHVDPDSTVCVKQFKRKIGCALNQGKILFKGGKVSMKLFCCPLNYFKLTLFLVS